MSESAESSAVYLGEFVIRHGPGLASAVIAVVAAYLNGRSGRKIRVKFHPSGDVEEVEALALGKLEKALKLAEDHQRHHPKLIQKP